MQKRRWQKGSVLVRGDVLRIQYRDATGRQVSETIGRFSEGQTREDARAELAARVRAVAKESYVHRHTSEPAAPLFEEWAKKWVDRKERLGLDPRTARSYERKLRLHCARFHGVPLNEIDRQDVNALIGDLLDHPYAPRTINHTVTVLHGLFSAAVREGLLAVNPAKETDRPSIKKYPARPLKPNEVDRVRHYLDTPRFLLLYDTLALLGLRAMEAQGLRWKNVDLEARRLRVEDSKTEKGERVLAIPPGLAASFDLYRASTPYNHDEDFVFCHPELGNRLNGDHFREAMHEALEKAGIREVFRPFHDLRVTALTNASLAGFTPQEVMEMAGHEDYKTTQIYVRLAGEVFPDKAAALEARYAEGRAEE